MSERHSRHGDSPEDRNHERQQPGMEPVASSPDLESKILSRLGLSSKGAEEWQQRIREIEWNIEHGGNNALGPISSFLNHPNKAIRIAALRGLLALEKRDPGLVPLKPFVDALYDDEPQIRLAALEALTSYGARRLLKEILNDLENKLKNEDVDEWERMWIVHLLASLGDQVPVALLVNALQDKHWQVREAAVLALGTLIQRLEPQQRERLDTMLYDDDDFVRQAALLVLRKYIPTERLLADLRSGDSEKQRRAARVVGELKDHEKEMLAALQDILRAPQASNKLLQSALEAMAELRMPVGERLLNRFLHHEDESIRAAASMLYDALHPNPEPEARRENITDISQHGRRRRSIPRDENRDNV